MDGEISEGQFINGNLRQGTITYPNGDIIEGTFARNLLNGPGKFTYDKGKGKILEGTFKDGKLKVKWSSYNLFFMIFHFLKNFKAI